MLIEEAVGGIIDKATSTELILHIHYHVNANEGSVPTVPPGPGNGTTTPPPPVEPAPTPPPPQFPNTTLVTVSNPDKPHALLSWAEKNNNADVPKPMFTFFPSNSTDPEEQARRVKLPNGTQLLVKDQVVQGDGGHLAFRIVDHDGYFAGLGDPDMDVTKLYIRKEWTLAE